MMVRYAPFTIALGDKHGEARWGRYRLALYHPGKCVKAGNYSSVIVDLIVRRSSIAFLLPDPFKGVK